VRIFIAIPLNKKIKDDIYGWKKEIEKFFIGKIKWVEYINLHITLNFLGSVDEDIISKIKTDLEKELKDVKLFDIKFKGIRFFPSIDNISAIWVGIADGKENMINLYNIISNVVVKYNIKLEEREFIPHITLGRGKENVEVKSNFNYDFWKEKELDGFKVKNISIFESKISFKGPAYKEMYFVNLSSRTK
jgi:RNA 2',3'-cyclic 3'-phosphodiesterase